jgi:hypothetical protein
MTATGTAANSGTSLTVLIEHGGPVLSAGSRVSRVGWLASGPAGVTACQNDILVHSDPCQ